MILFTCIYMYLPTSLLTNTFFSGEKGKAEQARPVGMAAEGTQRAVLWSVSLGKRLRGRAQEVASPGAPDTPTQRPTRHESVRAT